jgi:hypothetical protein
MPERDDDSHPILARIRQELGKLPLTDEEIDRVAPRIAADTRYFSQITPESGFFDFEKKINAVVERFAADGLTEANYLHAVLKHPQLLSMASATVIANITASVEHFAGEGLNTSDYLRAAQKHPSLFYQKPATIAGNITGVVEQFAADGLTLRNYLAAALKQPQLFSLPPATVARNIMGVAEHFAADGLATPDYLKAAVKFPSLFTQSPATIIGHVNLLIDLQRQGLISFKDEAPPDQPLRPLFAYLVKNPKFFSLADENYTVREISTHVSGGRPNGTALFWPPRHKVESKLAEELGHSDLATPVPKEPSPEEGGNARQHARNLLLRALIREGIVKGTLER